MDGATLINRGGSPFVSNKDALVEGLIFRTNREYQICQAARDLSSLFFSSCWSTTNDEDNDAWAIRKKYPLLSDIFLRISRNVGFTRFEDGYFTPILSAFRRMQRSSNVPQTVGPLRKPYRGHQSTTLAEKSLRYWSFFNFNFLYFSKTFRRRKLEYRKGSNWNILSEQFLGN